MRKILLILSYLMANIVLSLKVFQPKGINNDYKRLVDHDLPHVRL